MAVKKLQYNSADESNENLIMATGGVAAETSNEPARCMQVRTQENGIIWEDASIYDELASMISAEKGIFVDTTGFDISSHFFQLISLN